MSLSRQGVRIIVIMAKVIDLETGLKVKEGSIKPRIKATVRQRKVVKALENGAGTMAEAMINAGYSVSVANKPQVVTESKGFIALMDSLGLTDEYLGQKLQEDIEGKPKNRVAELTLAYKVKGRLKDSEVGGNFTPATINIAIMPSRGSDVSSPNNPVV